MSHTQYKDVVIHYKDEGNGPAVVLLHGFLEDHSMWDDMAKEFSSSHRVIRIDLLGHGATGVLGDIHSMEDQAEMVKALTQKIKIDRYTLIGHSMGGYIALALADLYPEDIAGLCLMNSTSLPDSPEKKINRDRAVEAVRANHRSFVRIAIPGLFAPDSRKRFQDRVKEVTEVALAIPPEGITAALEGMKIRKDRSKIFKEGRYPKLLIIGKQDPALDLETLIPQTKYPDVESTVFDDGHMSHIENQKELTETLRRFIERISS